MALIYETYDMPRVQVYIPNKLADASDVWKIASEEIVGIEVEVENQVHRRPSNPVWTITEDGSLRNGGVEFISRPIRACDAPAALNHLFKGDFDQQYCFSPRTSVHVHLNMQDVQSEKVVDLLLVYCLFEKSLYRFVGKGRWKNIYCTPITESGFLYNLAGRGIRTPWEKYTGFNMLPLQQKGTVEFRHMHGTIDAKKLSIWIDLITRMKAYVLRNKTEDIRRTIIGFGGGDVERFAQEVFGELSVCLELSNPGEVVSRITAIKLGNVKTASLNDAIRKTIKNDSKFFKVA